MKTVIKMGASWCRPCLQLKPIFDEVVAEIDNIRVVNINVDDTPDIASSYGVRSVPTVIIVDENDKIVAMKSGYMNKEELEKFIKNGLVY